MIDIQKLILQAWLSYIRLEEFTQAEVECGRGEYPRILDKGVQIVGNKLLLPTEIFQTIKQQQGGKNNGKYNEPQIAVTFPQIYFVQGKGKEQKLKYLPLFTIDISSIFKGKHYQSGWDLTELDTKFEFQPVVANLMRLYGFDEEKCESLVVAQGILKFLEDTFKRCFPTLRDFIDQVDFPVESAYKTSRQPYLVRCDLTPFNALLKQDLQSLLQSLQQSPTSCGWLAENHPAMQYLSDKPKLSGHKVILKGAFPSHPPDEYQMSALQHAQQNSLTAVSGAPGTGKTEVFLHSVAQQVVERALSIAHGKEDKSNLTFFSSTNNAAIQKFQQRLIDNLPTKFFYLKGGSQTIIKNETLPKIQQACDWLQTTQFDQESWTTARHELLEVSTMIQDNIDSSREQINQQASNSRLTACLKKEIQLLENDIAIQKLELQKIESQLSQLNEYSNFPEQAYQQIHSSLEKAEKELPSVSDSIMKRTLDWLNANNEKRVFKRLSQNINAAVLSTLATSFPFQMPLDRYGLTIAQTIVIKHLEQWRVRSLKVELYTQTQTRLAALTQQLESKQRKLNQLQQLFDTIEQPDLHTPHDQNHYHLQVKLFQCAWNFLQIDAHKRKDLVVRALKTYGSALAGDGDSLFKLETDSESIYRDLSLIFPVISSSLQSIRNMLPILHPNIVKLALVDEAGTTLIHHLFPLLVRSQRAVVAGDPQQIEPIINLCDDTVKQYSQSAFIDQGMNLEDYYRYAPTAKYTATAYHRAAGSNGIEGDDDASILLKNHYRCAAPIIQFCIPNYSGGLNILSNTQPSPLGTHLLAFHVEGSHSPNNTNIQEIDAVEAIIAHLLQHGYSIDSDKSIGVISPFLQQANALRYRLRNRYQNFAWDSIGTVHNWMGGQRAAIIFSPCQCSNDQSFWFLNRRPNLLNTAVSRAKELFIVAGNLDSLKQAGGETKRLVEYIEQYGEICQVPIPTK